MREHQANIRIDKELWTNFKTRAQQRGSTATAEIISFIKAYLQDDETSLSLYPQTYIAREVESEIESTLNQRFNDAVNDFEKILKHEIDKHYSELNEMYNFRLQTIEDKLGIDADPLLTAKRFPEVIQVKPKTEDHNQLEEVNDIDSIDSIDERGNIDEIDNIDEISKLQEKILLSDKQLKEKESLTQHPTTIGRWRKSPSKIPNELMPILGKYEIIGSKWAVK